MGGGDPIHGTPFHQLQIHHKLENFIVQVWQTFVPIIGIDHQGFWRCDLVVGCKLSGWRANRIHQANSHEHFGVDARGQVLVVDVTELGEDIWLSRSWRGSKRRNQARSSS